jgi:DNA-binding NtrC family response regulator
VDVRIIAATNKQLEELVKTGKFREDLYFRLNVIPIHIPPLRERPEDILPMADHFLSEFSREFKRPVMEFSAERREQMMGYSWPGNVRELKNVIERAIILGAEEVAPRVGISLEVKVNDGSVSAESEPSKGWETGIIPGVASISGKDVVESPIQYPAQTGSTEPGDSLFRLPPSGIILEEVVRDFILQALEITGGNQTRAAEALGLTRDALRYRMKKFGFQ